LFPEPGETVKDWVIACKIALAHLKERPDYYIKLADMEHSPLVVRKPEQPLVRQEYKKVIEQMVEEVLNEIHYPPKAIDYNRLPDPDGFWGWGIKQASDASDLHEIGAPFKRIADLILWLNRAAEQWEKYSKSMGRK
jgi:hypothetical protein